VSWCLSFPWKAFPNQATANRIECDSSKRGLDSSGIDYGGNLVVLMGLRKSHRAFVPTEGKHGDEALLFVSMERRRVSTREMNSMFALAEKRQDGMGH